MGRTLYTQIITLIFNSSSVIYTAEGDPDYKYSCKEFCFQIYSLVYNASLLTGLNIFIEDVDLGSKILKQVINVHYSGFHFLYSRQETKATIHMNGSGHC